MKPHKYLFIFFLLIGSLTAAEEIPQEMKTIMRQKKYEHSIWSIYVKDLENADILYGLNFNKLFSPASTTKLFSVEALLHTFGDDYRFKTPVYASGTIDEAGTLKGNLILVAQGDFIFGGRELEKDKVDFTKLDHINANDVPGTVLTKGDPLRAFNELAQQIASRGIKEVTGTVIIDDSLFESVEKRGMNISPIIINENLIDITLNPANIGDKAHLSWRPMVKGYTVENQVKTVGEEENLNIVITSDEIGRTIIVKGSIPVTQKESVRTFSIKDPQHFAVSAFIEALQKNGVKVNQGKEKTNSYKNQEPIALFVSPPLSEYAKLILKVSHNLGANLVPLLLATHQGKRTFDDGMKILGTFVTDVVKISPDAFVFIDAAGGNDNRLTPKAEIQLLEFIKKQKPERFQKYFDALPILGVDGSLQDFAKKTEGAGKIRAKTGTGAAINLATEKPFLITLAYAGYIEGKNGHLHAFVVIVNNAALNTFDDILDIFEDEGQISNIIYKHTD